MSSVFLYLAIVAIWAFVLVPRWLRRQRAAPQPGYEAGYAPGPAGYDEDGYDRDDGAGDYGTADGAQQPYRAALPAGTAASARHEAAAPRYAAQTWQHQHAQAAPPLSRSRVLQARRRLLTMLVLLAAASGICTALKLTSWWVCIPPALMLGMYLLLLREAAIADAEQAHWRAVIEERARAERERRHLAEAPPAQADQTSAEVIDISARVGDVLYDQYADATVRAVGD